MGFRVLGFWVESFGFRVLEAHILGPEHVEAGPGFQLNTGAMGLGVHYF